MKRILSLLTGVLICLPAAAQLPTKAVTGAVKALEGGAKKLPASARLTARGLRPLPVAKAAVPPVGVSAGQPLVDVTALEQKVAQQVSLKVGLESPAAWVRRKAAAKQVPDGILQALFAVPSQQERTALLQNEFLTLTLQRGVSPSAQQAAQALEAYRRDLIAHPKGFSGIKKLTAANDAVLESAGGLLADMAGIGFYGTAQDAALLVNAYQTAASSELEPVVFTAAARALLRLRAYGELEQVMALAQPSAARSAAETFIRKHHLPVSVPPKPAAAQAQRDWNKLAEPLGRASRLNRLQLDLSERATEKWMKMTVRLLPQETKAAARPTVLQQPISLHIAPSLQAQQLPGVSSPAPQERASYGFFQRSQPSSGGVLYSGLPVMDWLGKAKKWFSPAKQTPQQPAAAASSDEYNPVVPVLRHTPRTGLMSNQYPSGLKDEESIIRDWLEYFKNGYFRPRNQVEAIEGMSAAKANNVMEYLYYMPLEEAEKVILNPIRETGRLPDFMYDDRLIAGTKRLPAGYYKNKFNENVTRFVELAEEDGSIYTHNVELKDLATSMADYSFKQGFRYTNDPQMTAGLRHNWKELVAEIRKPGLRADRDLINALWRKPVKLDGGKTVSLKEYFTQTRPTAFFKEGRMPEFFLNSNKWVAWENERRNLAAAEYIDQSTPDHLSWLERVQNWFVLGKTSSYLTLEQFGNIMASQYRKSFGAAVRTNEQEYTHGVVLEDATPSSMTVKINNFDKVGGVCQMSFSEGGYMGRVKPGYDGTSTVSRFDFIRFPKVPVVTFDFGTLKPHIVTLESVPYLRDLKEPDLDQVRASTMVGDGLDPTRDLLGVREAEAALFKIPHLKATLYPRARLEGYDQAKPKYLDGGGLAGYLTLFTPDFYPIKKIKRLRFKGLKPYIETQYFIRREVAALAGLIHRDRLTFTEQVQDRIVPDKAAPARPDDSQK